MLLQKCYCSHYQHSLVVKTQNINIYQAPYLSSRKALSPPPPLKWGDIYPSFLSGSVQFFLFKLLFFASLLISSPWRGKWWGIFRLCWFSTIVYSLGLSLNIWPGKSGQCAVGVANDWHFSDTPLGSDWLCWSGSGGSCKSNYNHWVEPQTVDFYTADLYPIICIVVS